MLGFTRCPDQGPGVVEAVALCCPTPPEAAETGDSTPVTCRDIGDSAETRRNGTTLTALPQRAVRPVRLGSHRVFAARRSLVVVVRHVPQPHRPPDLIGHSVRDVMPRCGARPDPISERHRYPPLRSGYRCPVGDYIRRSEAPSRNFGGRVSGVLGNILEIIRWRALPRPAGLSVCSSPWVMSAGG
jgi:hypothetical protein